MRNQIITLDNLDEYLIIDDTVQGGKQYLLSLKLDENKEPVKTPTILLFEDNENIKVVKEETLLNLIYAVFISNLITELERK